MASFRPIPSAPLLALLLAAAAAPGHAQTGNQSDVTGVIVTGGGGAGFIPGRGLGAGRAAVLVEDRGGIRFGSGRVSCGVATAADSTLLALRDGTLRLVGAHPAVDAGDAERRLAALVGPAQPAGGADGNGEAAFALALARHADGTASDAGEQEAAAALARALAGLLAGHDACMTGDGRVSATQLAAAFAAYDAFVQQASDRVLRAPPAELLAVQALLDRLARAGLAAAR